MKNKNWDTFKWGKEKPISGKKTERSQRAPITSADKNDRKSGRKKR